MLPLPRSTLGASFFMCPPVCSAHVVRALQRSPGDASVVSVSKLGGQLKCFWEFYGILGKLMPATFATLQEFRIHQNKSNFIKHHQNSKVSHWIPLLVSLLFASPTQLLISGRTSCTSMALQSSKAPHSCGAADIQGESQLSDTV